jgi:hypothetical protein
MAIHLTMGAGVPVSQDVTDTETEIEETLRQVQIDGLRRLAERLRNELDEVRKDRDAWRSRAAKNAVAKPAGWLRRLVG